MAKTNVSRTISVPVVRVLKWLEFPSVVLFAIQPLDAAGSPRIFYYHSLRESSRSYNAYKKGKVIPLHAMEEHGGRGGRAPTYT
jgi:hypothetical protein